MIYNSYIFISLRIPIHQRCLPNPTKKQQIDNNHQKENNDLI